MDLESRGLIMENKYFDAEMLAQELKQKFDIIFGEDGILIWIDDKYSTDLGDFVLAMKSLKKDITNLEALEVLIELL